MKNKSLRLYITNEPCSGINVVFAFIRIRKNVAAATKISSAHAKKLNQKSSIAPKNYLVAVTFCYCLIQFQVFLFFFLIYFIIGSSCAMFSTSFLLFVASRCGYRTSVGSGVGFFVPIVCN